MKAELEALIAKMISSGILFEEAVKEFERHFIIQVVARNDENLSKSATELGIHRNTLTKRLQDYQAGQRPKTAQVITAGKSTKRQVAQRRKTRLSAIPK